jgi:riboflavin kinase/FMN adenylyltransferase
MLMDDLGMTGLAVGPDFALGHDRAGNVQALQRLGEAMGFSVTVVPLVQSEPGDKVSSTAVRTALAEGDVASVTRMLQRPYVTHGVVIRGRQRGRQLGYPTANIAPEPERALPADGIYATRTQVGERVYNSATYIGTSPTFAGDQRFIEVLLFDFAGDLYDHDLRVEWVEKVRGDQKFSSPEALQQQMAKDVERAKVMLAGV